jgi:hypothetical protein
MARARSRGEVAYDVGVPYNWGDRDENAQPQWPPAREPPRSMARMREPAWPPRESEPEIAFRSRRGTAGWISALALVSFVAGVLVRDKLPQAQVNGARAWVAQIVGVEKRIADHLGTQGLPAVGAAPTSHPSNAATTTQTTPQNTPPDSSQAAFAPPEVSFSSLPRASAAGRPVFRATPPAVPVAPPRARPVPQASPTPKPVPAKRAMVAEQAVAPEPAVPAEPAAPQENAVASEHPKPQHTKVAVEEPAAEAPAPTPAPPPEPPKAVVPKQPAVVIVPGSLEDLIRKEVQKDQGKKP